MTALARRGVEIDNYVAVEAGLINLGEAHQKLRRFDDALKCLADALRHSQRMGDTRNQGAAMHIAGLVHLDQKDFSRARECLERALSMLRQVGERDQLAGLLANLSHVCRALGRLDQAITYCDQTIELSREIGDRHCEAKARQERDRIVATLRGVGQARTA